MKFEQTNVVNILVSIACTVVLLSLVASCGLGAAQKQAQITKDQVTVRGLQQGCAVYAAAANGDYPLPGLSLRLPINMGGEQVRMPGRGEHDYSQDTSANLYSNMIMNMLIVPSGCISPLENHPGSQECAYNYDVYDPIAGSMWDPAFLVDPSQANQALHASYAHKVTCKDRKVNHDTALPTDAIFTLRGPAEPNGNAYDRSPTLQLIGPSDMWQGNVAFGDGSVGTLLSPFLDNADFLFAADEPSGTDQWVGVVITASDDCANIKTAFDPLYN
ncbi:MAG: hypothetical protein MK095_07370 [Phycisphaerales bacterium]|nr:hypothetical protein [Phycisphaerales bacterium]